MNERPIREDEQYRINKEITEDERKILNKMSLKMSDAVELSMPLVSGYKVGCVVRGESGEYYLGANLEVTTHHNLHAEQSAIHNAFIHGEKIITHIMISALPCGHCRQFLHGMNPDLVIFVDDNKYLLEDLLPEPFSKSDVGINQHFENTTVFENENHYSTFGQASKCCKISYSPLLKKKGGVCIKTLNGNKYYGSFIEDPALSPSILPIMGALSQMCLDEEPFSDIVGIVVVSNEHDYYNMHKLNAMEIARYLEIDTNKISQRE
jgi:cytidine deaminase